MGQSDGVAHGEPNSDVGPRPEPLSLRFSLCLLRGFGSVQGASGGILARHARHLSETAPYVVRHPIRGLKQRLWTKVEAQPHAQSRTGRERGHKWGGESAATDSLKD